ncbi:MAG: hypothetical protein EB127_31610 [Alphaproteobacteria bacterium]|nr:hypothetical protein [Alphaproteobacteria bacterium]
MAVTLSGNGIIFANGDLQNFAGIGASTQIGRGGSYFTPKWKERAGVVNGTFYTPSSNTEEICFVSVIVEIGAPDEVAFLAIRSPSDNIINNTSDYQWINWTGNARTVYTLSSIVPPLFSWRIDTNGNILSALEWKAS